jgi:hypothetical protein
MMSDRNNKQQGTTNGREWQTAGNHEQQGMSNDGEQWTVGNDEWMAVGPPPLLQMWDSGVILFFFLFNFSFLM